MVAGAGTFGTPDLAVTVQSLRESERVLEPGRARVRNGGPN